MLWGRCYQDEHVTGVRIYLDYICLGGDDDDEGKGVPVAAVSQSLPWMAKKQRPVTCV